MNDKLTDETSSIEYYSMIFYFILNLCQRLTNFHFCSSNYRVKSRPVQFSLMNCKSTILNELKIEINSFDECLYLFDGHFPSLSILIISVEKIKSSTSKIRKNTVNII
jgi:hypothetical protein